MLTFSVGLVTKVSISTPYKWKIYISINGNGNLLQPVWFRFIVSSCTTKLAINLHNVFSFQNLDYLMICFSWIVQFTRVWISILSTFLWIYAVLKVHNGKQFVDDKGEWVDHRLWRFRPCIWNRDKRSALSCSDQQVRCFKDTNWRWA